MNNKLILRALTSPFPSPYGDITKGSVLSHADVDNNFIYLKGNIIVSATTNGGIVSLTKINGDIIQFSVGSGSGSTGLSADTYWISGSTWNGTNYPIKAKNDSGLDSTGSYAVAEGCQTLASGPLGSHAEGYNTVASGMISHAEGQSTQAIGDSSHAEGIATISSSDGSHSEGSYTIASNSASHAEGNFTIASGEASHAEGIHTTASGTYSHAEGQYTTASGETSHAEGIDTYALGPYSHAEGNSTSSTGYASHSEGAATTASGYYSHAGGVNSIANGETSFVHGSGSTANGINAVVFGANITGNQDNTTYVDNLNVKTLGVGIPITNLGIDSNGFIVSGNTGTGTVSKYVSGILSLTGGTPYTIYHNLGTPYVSVDIIDTDSNSRINAVVDTYLPNSVDITTAIGVMNARIIIIG